MTDQVTPVWIPPPVIREENDGGTFFCGFAAYEETMTVLESKCKQCGSPVRIHVHDPSLEVLIVERTCACPIKEPPVLAD